MTKISKRAAAALLVCAPLVAACAAPAPLPESDPLVARGVEAFEAGCLSKAPDFSSTEAVWSSLGVQKWESNKTRPPYDILGVIPGDGVCTVWIKGNAQDVLWAELQKLLESRNATTLNDPRKPRTLTHSKVVEVDGVTLGVGVGGRPIPRAGFWSRLVVKHFFSKPNE